MLFKHSVLYLLARGLPGIINFLAIAIYTRILSPEEYGRYALVVSGVGFFNVVFFQWLRLALLRFLPAYFENPKPLFSTVLAGFATLVLLTGTIGILLAVLWPDSDWQGLISFAIPLLWVQAWFELNLELNRSRLQPVRYGLMSGLKAILSLGLGVLIVLWGFGVYGPLMGLLTGMLVAGLWGGWTDWKKGFSNFSSRLLKELLCYGLPLTATFALAFIVSASDRFLIAYFLGESKTGPYAAGYEFAWSSIVLFMFIINLGAYPLTMRAFEKNGEHAAQRQLKQNSLLQMIVACPATVGMIIIASQLGELIFGENYRDESTSLIPWIAVAAFLHGIRSYHFDLAFHLGKYTVGQIWVMGGAAIINIILNWFWIPKYGILGAARATLVAYTVALLLSVGIGHRVFIVPVDWWGTVRVFFASLVMAGVLFFWPKKEGFIGLMEMVFIGIVVYGLLIFLLFWRNLHKFTKREL